MVIYDFRATDSDGASVNLDKYRGKVVIIVNTASQCGLTDANYSQLQQILQTYKMRGLEIAVFPCNQFGNQEPGCDADIQKFVREKFRFDPDLYSKVEVNGDNADPLWKHIKAEGKVDKIKWNFTKFLINRTGHVAAVFGPRVEPKKMVEDIEKALLQGDYVKNLSKL